MDNGNGSNLENVIDRILLSARDLKSKLETVRSHEQDHDTKHQLIQFGSNHKIKELERENRELRQALEDHQYGLEFIMSKYRSQVVKLIELNRAEQKPNHLDMTCLKRNNSVE